MSELGPQPVGSTFAFKFTTSVNGVPTALSTSQGVGVYQQGNTTPLTTGVTLTGGYNSVVGLNDVTIITTSTSWTAATYDVVITTGTLAGISMVGFNVGSFQIANISLAATGVNLVEIAGTTSVAQAGYVGVDWGQVANKTTVNALTQTSIASVTGAVGSVTGAVGSVTGSVGSVVAQVTANVTDINAVSVAAVTAVGPYIGSSVAPSLTAAGLANISSNVKQNTATNGFMFIMTYASSHAPAAGLGSGITGQVALNGGAFAPLTNASSEVANGWYTVNLAAGDLNGAHVALRFSNAVTDDTDIEINTQP